MPILNYTTKVSADKTIAEIQKILIRAKADAVMCEYENCVPTRVTFRIATPQGVIHYRLPSNAAGVLSAMKRDNKVPRSKCTIEQAARVSWRIVKDWVEAQIAIIRQFVGAQPANPTAWETFREQQRARVLEAAFNMLMQVAGHDPLCQQAEGYDCCAYTKAQRLFHSVFPSQPPASPADDPRNNWPNAFDGAHQVGPAGGDVDEQ